MSAWVDDRGARPFDPTNSASIEVQMSVRDDNSVPSKKRVRPGGARNTEKLLRNNTSGLQGIWFTRTVVGKPPVWNYRVCCSYSFVETDEVGKPIRDQDGKPVVKLVRTGFSTKRHTIEGALMRAITARRDRKFKVPTLEEAHQAFARWRALTEKEDATKHEADKAGAAEPPSKQKRKAAAKMSPSR